VLSQNGHTDLAFKLLLNRSFPSWLFSVRMGATTMWEHWDSLKEDGSMWSSDMNSFNHYAYGAVGDWLMGAVLGINPMTPGYEQVLLTPHADKRLGYARGSFDTARGTVQSGWQVQDDSVCYRFLLPRGMTGKAVIAGEEYPLSEGETTLTLPL
jgi:alpha-L-rhamnosidase